jgi:hypothetical protein
MRTPLRREITSFGAYMSSLREVTEAANEIATVLKEYPWPDKRPCWCMGVYVLDPDKTWVCVLLHITSYWDAQVGNMSPDYLRLYSYYSDRGIRVVYLVPQDGTVGHHVLPIWINDSFGSAQ